MYAAHGRYIDTHCLGLDMPHTPGIVCLFLAFTFLSIFPDFSGKLSVHVNHHCYIVVIINKWNKICAYFIFFGNENSNQFLSIAHKPLFQCNSNAVVYLVALNEISEPNFPLCHSYNLSLTQRNEQCIWAVMPLLSKLL